MTRLFLIRHGAPQQDWGGADADPGLSEQGCAQAEAAALALAREGPLQAVSSPMRRCRQTAARFAGASPLIEPRVSEVATPAGIADRRAWLTENFPWAEGAVRRRWPTLDPVVRSWRDDVLAAVRALPADSAIFTHFIAINAIVGAALGRDETIVCRPDYASITALDLNSGTLRLLVQGAEMNQGEVR